MQKRRVKRFPSLLTRPLLNTVSSCLLLLTVLSSGQASAPVLDEVRLFNGALVRLHGMGLYQHLRKDIFLAALYAEPGSVNQADLSEQPGPQRMSLKLVADDFRASQMARLWKERIAINNPRATWQPYAAHILSFANLFQTRLVAGDRIDIDYVPNEGVLVSFNDIPFQRYPDDGFYQLLLSTWIGEVPPTSGFKAGISGQLPATELASMSERFTSLMTLPARIPMPTSVTTELPQVAVQQNQQQLAQAQAQAQLSSDDAPDDLSDKASSGSDRDDSRSELTESPGDREAILAQADADSSAQSHLDEAVSSPDAMTSSAPVTADAQIAGDKRSEVDSSGEQPAKKTPDKEVSGQETTGKEVAQRSGPGPSNAEQQAALTRDVVAVRAPALDDSLSGDARSEYMVPIQQAPSQQQLEQAISAALLDRDLLRGSYKRELVNLLKKQQQYPSRAWRLGLQGDGVVSINITRDGRVESMDILQSTGHRMLDKAIRDMVTRAEPLPAVPQELPETHFELTLPVSFNR